MKRYRPHILVACVVVLALLTGLRGILQDALSHDNPIGLYGIAKTIVGYIASSIGAKIDTEHPVSRFGMIFLFFHLHQAVLAVELRVLLNRPAPFFALRLLLDSVVTAAIGVFLFALLDRLRKGKVVGRAPLRHRAVTRVVHADQLGHGGMVRRPTGAQADRCATTATFPASANADRRSSHRFGQVEKRAITVRDGWWTSSCWPLIP